MLEELLDVNPNEVELPELVLNPAVDVLDEDEELCELVLIAAVLVDESVLCELVLIAAVEVLLELDELELELTDEAELLLSSSMFRTTGACPFGWHTTPDNNPSR